MANTIHKQFPQRRYAAKGLSCRRGSRMVFEALEFDIGAGDYLLLKGNNGSGKSTLLRLLAGLLPAYAGNISWDGEPAIGPQAAQANDILYSGHQHGLKSALSLRENCSNLYKLMTGSVLSDIKLGEAAQGFGLDDLIDLPLKYFSSGQTHRCALMRFLLLDRQIWLMDEPTVGLDSENRQRLKGLMADHLAKGGIIVAASHDPIEVKGKLLNLEDFKASTQYLEAWL